MSMEEDWGKFQGMMEAHVKQADNDRDDHKNFRKTMYGELRNINTKADKAHTRIDIQETKISTLKWIAGFISGSIAAAYHFFKGE